MSEKPSAKPENRGEVVTTLAFEMKRSIALLGQPAESRERVIELAARRASITYRQAKSLFYGETADPKHSVVERVRQAVAAKTKLQEEARGEYRSLLARIERLENALRVQDENFHSDQIDALRSMARGSDRAVGGK